MLAVRIPDDLDARLTNLAKKQAGPRVYMFVRL
jgi:predicted transcriptional regulator